jgi:four helix bundle protein
MKSNQNLQTYQNLSAWKSAEELNIYLNEVLLHPSLDYRRYLRDQILRASLSVALNISEGHGRGYNREFVRFLRIARASLDEVHAGLTLMKRTLPEVPLDPTTFNLISTTRIRINALIKRIHQQLELANSLTHGTINPQAPREAP